MDWTLLTSSSENPQIISQFLPPLLILLALTLALYKRNTWKYTSIDAVLPPYPPYGRLETLTRIACDDAVSNMLHMAQVLGPVFRLRLPFLGPSWVIVSDLDTCRKVLSDNTAIKPKRIYETYALGLGAPDSIFASEGPFWVHSRKSVAPAFSMKHVRRMNEVVLEKTTEFMKRRLDKLADAAENGGGDDKIETSFDLTYEMLHLSLESVAEAAFEYRMEFQERETFMNELEIALMEAPKGDIPLRWRLGSFIPAVRRSWLAVERVQAIGKKILDTYRNLESPTKGTVINCIVNNENYENDNERVVDILTFIIAGNETTAYTISWTLLELARNPVEQRKLQVALMNEKTENRHNLSELGYVIKEGMRMNAVTGAVGPNRQIMKDLIVKKDDETDDQTPNIVIPKGSIVFPSLSLLFRNKKYFEDPLSFKPSRWENPSEKAKAAFIPFFIGRRNCVGQTLANATMNSVLSCLCAEYHFSIADEGTVSCFFSHRPVGVRLFVKRVTPAPS